MQRVEIARTKLIERAYEEKKSQDSDSDKYSLVMTFFLAIWVSKELNKEKIE